MHDDCVEISPLLEATAWTFARNVEATDTVKHTENWIGSANKERYFVGYLGELALVQLLWVRKCRDFYYRPTFTGRSEPQDFVMGDRRTIDVKTNDINNYKVQYLLVSDKARQRSRCDVFIAAHRHKYLIEFGGWLTGDEVMALPVKVFNKEIGESAYCAFRDLRPMDEFWQPTSVAA